MFRFEGASIHMHGLEVKVSAVCFVKIIKTLAKTCKEQHAFTLSKRTLL